MNKKVLEKNVYYVLKWTKSAKYDKYSSIGIPDIGGILCIQEKIQNQVRDLIYIGCYRNGLRSELKRFFDPHFTKIPNSIDDLKEKNLYFKYAIFDGKLEDIQDVLFWLIKSYNPQFNDLSKFKDSQRYINIFGQC